MARHVGDLLARSLDEDLSEAERVSVIEHLAGCEDCRELQAELRRTEARLSSAVAPTSSLRPLSKASRASSFLGPIAVTGAALLVALIVGNGLYAQRAGQPGQSVEPMATEAATSSPPSSPQPSQSAASPFFLVVGRTAEAGTGSISRVDIVSVQDAIRSSHELVGLLGGPVYDGATKLAYWRRGSGTTASELVVWDMARGTTRTVFRSESQAGTLIWSAGRDRLVVVVKNDSLSDRLVVIELASGSSREVAVFSDRPTVDPIYADERVIAGYGRTGTYEVLDARTGQLLSAFPISSFVGYGGTQPSRDGMVFDLETNFEAPARPLYVWRVDAPQDPVAVVEQGELHDPLFRPEHSEILYGDGFELEVVDYGTGHGEVVHAFPRTDFGWPTPIAFDARGEHLLVRSHAGFQVFAMRDRQLQHVADARLADPRVSVMGLIAAADMR